MEKLIREKMEFLGTLREEWVEDAATRGIYDPKTREIEFKTSYSE